ncbi:uncharacterized protein BX663DRAFT_495198 [Cokeromyces recurvatus]|uniref:uncharacterized protein n=1 Tax=Cokeromyces recurvatus TaxID=90255 RepID=UPI002220BD23|nr:uncharacterized protein BX663DRAFT_495198 [Cokeromyces recurvatus]KAI7907213.1 hypothetical protein BX663DRAFT_495198 [Cokeromyces recurvatus]
MALFVGKIPRDMNDRDLEDTFIKYGKITRLNVKQGYGFVEFEDKRDAEDAIKAMNERGELIVEWAKNNGKKAGKNECFHCGKEGHWARDCAEGGNRRNGGYEGRNRRNRDYGRRRDSYGGRDRSPRRAELRDNRNGKYDRDRRDRGYSHREDRRREDIR